MKPSNGSNVGYFHDVPRLGANKINANIKLHIILTCFEYLFFANKGMPSVDFYCVKQQNEGLRFFSLRKFSHKVSDLFGSFKIKIYLCEKFRKYD
jgi:hypothetical protein